MARSGAGVLSPYVQQEDAGNEQQTHHQNRNGTPVGRDRSRKLDKTQDMETGGDRSTLLFPPRHKQELMKTKSCSASQLCTSSKQYKLRWECAG